MASARSSSGALRAAADGRDAALAGLPEEACRRLDLYAALLARWQTTINLVAPSTLPALWSRHIGDSRQVAAALPAAGLPPARRWVDLGSGGGFPGLVTAILIAGEPGSCVHLVESDKRKCAFLRAVARETAAPAVIHAARIEEVVPDLIGERIEAVSARALAALPRLIRYAAPLILAGATAIFPQGEAATGEAATGDVASAELTGPDADRRFTLRTAPSRSRSGSSLVIVRAVTPVEPVPASPPTAGV